MLILLRRLILALREGCTLILKRETTLLLLHRTVLVIVVDGGAAKLRVVHSGSSLAHLRNRLLLMSKLHQNTIVVLQVD